jgi:hypothetical protein
MIKPLALLDKKKGIKYKPVCRYQEKINNLVRCQINCAVQILFFNWNISDFFKKTHACFQYLTLIFLKININIQISLYIFQ